jgi:threonine dehydrogenase-like Zn-dependent dehydrogenase
MKALYLSDGEIRLRRITKPIPTSNEALVKVKKAGICNTDLELIKGYMGFEGIPGHEFVGRVVQSPSSEWTGKRVVGEINLSCGHCDFCRQRQPKHCLNRSVLGLSGKNGAFAEYLTLPLQNLHVVPDTVSDTEAVFVEPLAAACDVLDQTEIDRRTSVAVLGDGKLGLLIAQVIKQKTHRVFCYGKHGSKLEILKKAGIRTSIQGKTKKRFDVVVEATGHVSGLRHCLSIVKPKGSIVLKSTLEEPVPFDTSKIVVDEIRLVGSRCGPFERALDLLENKSIRVEDLVSGEFSLEQYRDAFALAVKSEAVKVLLVP